MERNKKTVLILLCGIFVLTLGVNLLYFIGAYPGNMTIDSVNQFNQIATNQYNNYHPVFSSVIYKIPTLIYFSPASIIFAQILLFSIVVTYGAYCIFKYSKINSWIIFIITLAFSLSITNGFMLTNMWKDVPYSIFIMLLTVYMFNIVITDGEWISKKRNIFLMILAMAVIALIRHNGIVVIGLTGLSLVILRRKEFKKYLIFTFIALVCFFAGEKVIEKVLNASDTLSKADIVSVPLQQIAAVIQSNGNLDEDQKETLYKIAPEEEWSSKYNRYLSDNIKNLANEKFIEEPELRTEIIKMYPKICVNNIGTVTKAYLYQTSIIWRLRGYDRGALTFYTLEENDYGFEKHELVPSFTKIYKKLLDVTREKSILKLIVWNPAILMYIAIALIIVTVIKTKKAGIVIISMPMFANIAGLLISIPAQDYRYLYANILCIWIILLYSVDDVWYNGSIERDYKGVED